MKYLDFKHHFEPFKIFCTRDILKWDPGFDTRRLVEWQQKNYIRKIVNRWYIFNDTPLTEDLLFLISNRIYSPSYVSFETAMDFYQLIPEGVYTITSATSLKTHQFNTTSGVFNYRHLKPELMFGYKLIGINDQSHKMAEPEKLILDYFYLNTAYRSEDDMNSLRINQAELLELINEDRLRAYLEIFENKSLEKRIDTFINTIMHA